MKTLGIFIFLLSIIGNEEYTFDYRLEYKSTVYSNDSKPGVKNGTKTWTTNYYVSTVNNTYLATVSSSSNREFNFVFNDYRKFSTAATAVGDFKNPGNVTIFDSLGFRYTRNTQYPKPKNDYFPMKDTIINNKVYGRALLRTIDLKREKRKNLHRKILIIDKTVNTKTLLTSSWNFIKTINSNNLPEGLLVQELHYDIEGNLIRKDSLVEMAPVNFKLIVKEN